MKQSQESMFFLKNREHLDVQTNTSLAKPSWKTYTLLTGLIFWAINNAYTAFEKS